MGVSRPTVDLCIKKALCGGIDVALKDLPRSGRTNVITADDKTWVMSLAYSKPTDHGYASEKWTLKQLAKHVRTHAQATGHPSLDRAGKATVQRILQENEIKSHKTAYYLERRDPEFEEKMAQVLFVYKEIEHGRLIGEKNEDRRETTVSYDEKPGIQAIANIAADLAPVSHRYTAWARDYEYKRLGTVSLLAGLDLHDGHVHALVRDRHRGREFTEFLEEMDHYYPSDWRSGELGDWDVWVEHEKSLIRGRVCALRKSKKARDAARLRTLRARTKKGKVKPETLEAAEYTFVFTTLQRKFSPTIVLETYRGRWQVELAFKRLKSIIGLGHLRKIDIDGAKAWLHGKLLVAFLTEALIIAGTTFSPWGYALIEES